MASPTMFIAPLVVMGWSYLEIDTSPDTPGLFYLRCAFCSSLASAFLMLFISYLRIKARLGGDKRTVIVKTAPATGEPPVEEKISYEEHDLRAFQKALQQQMVIVCLMAFMHLKYAYVRPLVVQTVVMPLTFLRSNLGKVYILGESPDSIDLKRPWSAPTNPFEAMLQPAAEPAGKKKN
eukprot:m.259074 g.259074  ORF g.259074 m.259074 type:complete len:179 (-) comp37552_c0_seq1:83-619(-)